LCFPVSDLQCIRSLAQDVWVNEEILLCGLCELCGDMFGLGHRPNTDHPDPYGLGGLSARKGLPAPKGLWMLAGEYGLPNVPYGFEMESGAYGFTLSVPRYSPCPLNRRGASVA